ncbi:MAG: peptide-binding protein [Gemmatimonadetes bacterium]|nr:peptide-binding protein [Gemmatimonadota bacterium]
MARPIACLVPLLAVSLLAVGCGGGTGERAPSSADYGKPVAGGTVVIGVTAEPDNLLDATSTSSIASDVISAVFSQLTRLAPDLASAEPEIARSWDVATDGLSVTFHLVTNARWHDGVPLTAQDVVFTHELLTDPVVGYSARSWKEFISGCVAEDDSTVTFRYDRQYPYQILDASVGVILPKHLLEGLPRAELAGSEFARNPVGSGPFRFRKWESQASVELVANDDYFQGRPYLDRVVFRVIPDASSLVAQLESGEIDICPQLPPHEAARLDALDAIRVEAYSGRNYTYIGWYSGNPLFESSRVRRALGMAIDRDAIIDALCYGYAHPMNGPVHPMLWSYDPNIPALPYDPQGALEILHEEGWTDTDGDGVLDKDGVPFSFELKTNLGNQIRMDAVVMLQSMFQKIGVKVQPRTLEWNVLWGSVVDHSYGSAVLVGWSVALKADLQSIFHSKSIDEKFNHTGYSNPEVDAAIDRALSARTFDEARPDWWRAQELIVADQPYTFLFRLDDVWGVNERIRGTVPDPRGYYLSLPQWWIPESRRRR